MYLDCFLVVEILSFIISMLLLLFPTNLKPSYTSNMNYNLSLAQSPSLFQTSRAEWSENNAQSHDKNLILAITKCNLSWQHLKNIYCCIWTLECGYIYSWQNVLYWNVPILLLVQTLEVQIKDKEVSGKNPSWLKCLNLIEQNRRVERNE